VKREDGSHTGLELLITETDFPLAVEADIPGTLGYARLLLP